MSFGPGTPNRPSPDRVSLDLEAFRIGGGRAKLSCYTANMARETGSTNAPAESRYAGILESLGRPAAAGSDIQSVLDVHRLLAEGIEGAAIRRLASYYELSTDDLTRLLGIKKRTLQRREKVARLPQGETDRLWRAAVILREATEILGSRGKAASWLHRENRALGGGRPLDMIATEAGYEEVRNVLGRIDWGVWS